MHVPSPSFAVNDTVVGEVAQVKYLGHVIANDMTDDADMMRQRRQLYALGNVLSRRFHMCSIEVKHSLFLSFCTPMYTCQLWWNLSVQRFSQRSVAHPKSGCQPKLQSMIESFHTDSAVQWQLLGAIRNPQRRQTRLRPCSNALWDSLWHVAKTCIRHNLARLRAKTKVRKVLIRDMLFADDAAVATHTQEELRSLMDCFSQACRDFGLTFRLKKTKVLGEDTEALPVITIDDYELDDVCQFTYLGSTITDNLSLDAELDKRIGKAAPTLARLTARVWTSPELYMKTKMAVYNACVIITLLYGSETWTTYDGQERRLNSFHLISSTVSREYPGRTK